MKRRSPGLMVVLTIFSFGLYWFYILYQWVKIVNKNDRFFFSPCLAVLLSVVTFGLAGLYFEYEIARRSSIIRKNDLSSSSQSSNDSYFGIELKDITLWGNLASIGVSAFSAGFLLWIAFLFQLWLMVALQKSLEKSIINQ